nr:FtsK/SpoIIIE domain-containing protein [Terrimesophilobacter mesophilus]
MVFALLGPVIALAGLGDARRRSRREARRERARFEREVVATVRAIDDAHAREREALDAAAPGAITVATSRGRSEWWRGTVGGGVPVRVGLGSVPSRIDLQPRGEEWIDDAPGGSAHHETDRHVLALRRLRERAGFLPGAPIVIDARPGIGICGSGAEAIACASAIVLQISCLLSPDDVELWIPSNPPPGLDWIRGLPHARHAPSTTVDDPGGLHIEFHSSEPAARIHLAIAADERALPRECRVILRIRGRAGRIIRHPDRLDVGTFAPDFVSDRQARQAAASLSTAHLGAVTSRPAIPGLVRLGDFEQQVRTDGRSLQAIVGRDSNGPVVIDLVRDGPHAVVGGTTGSGKSELLVTWILALAAGYDPTQVNFLLVDFKGGAAFAPIASLPHTVGVMTDLDASAAGRAIASLGAELRRRERVLASNAVRSVGELAEDAAIPSLVIVVDEFAAMMSELRDLHDLFSDLAARGRSLGIHLILCTQRPAGAISESILANCGLRVALRVNNASDSIAIIGSADAATLPQSPSGRGLIAHAGGPPGLVQWAISDAADVSSILSRNEHRAWAPHRPWLDPLPLVLSESDVPVTAHPSISFGLVDIPHEQRRDVATFTPSTDGNLVVFGGHESGKSTALAALARSASSVVVIPPCIEGAWDAVSAALESTRRGHGPALVLLDDVESVIGRFGPDHETAFIDMLTAIAREGPRSGTALVITAGSPRGRCQSLVSLCESTLLLRMPSRQDHVLAGGAASDFVADLAAGGGRWKGLTVQVVATGTLAQESPPAAPVLELPAGGTCIVVSQRPGALRNRLERIGQVRVLEHSTRPSFDDAGSATAGSPPAIFVADADTWQSSWSVLASLKTRSQLVFHECCASDFRLLTRSRQVLLPTDPSADTVVVLQPDGRMSRAMLP